LPGDELVSDVVDIVVARGVEVIVYIGGGDKLELLIVIMALLSPTIVFVSSIENLIKFSIASLA
jgi:hypothetical protein